MELKNDDTVKIEKLIRCPVEAVWQAWTDPALVLKWFGSDPAGTGLEANLDVRTGGRFEVTFSNADHAEHTCSGVYTEIIEFEKLAFTWEWKSEPGVISQVSVRFAPEASYTRMWFEHAGVGERSAHDYMEGWNTTFLKLEKLLTRTP
jgi:uncharacterized protein YndB with AHSA1/START domain